MWKIWILIGASLAATGVTARAAQAESLQEALVLAYQANPALAAAQAELRAIDEGVPQALSGWRPNIAASGEVGRGWRETAPASPVFGGKSNLRPLGASLNIKQPLYNGGSTVAQTDSAEAAVLAGRFDLSAVEQQVLREAIVAYVDVLRDAAVLDLNRNNEQVLRRQLEANQNRFEVGEITRTDVAQAEARLSRATADRITAEGGFLVSRAAYSRAIGQAPGALSKPPPLPVSTDSFEQALEIAFRNNPQLNAALHREESARHQISAASGALLPELSVNATLSRNEEGSIKDFVAKDARVTANVTVPLYESGNAYSQVRQLRQINAQRRLQVDDARRLVRESLTAAQENLVTARANLEARRTQIEASVSALAGIRQEAEVGARTVLDVLDAEQETLDARVALVRAERDEYVANADLQAALGQLTAEAMGLPVQRYDPTVNYDRVRNKWIGLDGGLK